MSTTVPTVSSHILCLIIGHSTDIIADDLADHVPQGQGRLGAPHAHQGPPPSENTVQPFVFNYTPPPQTLAQQTPLPYAGNAVQTTAPPATTVYPIPPGYAPASQRTPGANTAQLNPFVCAPSPHLSPQPPTPQETKTDSPSGALPKKRGRGRPAGSRDKEKRDPKGTHAGKTKGELSKLARERAKRRRMEAEQAEEGEEQGQGQGQVPVQQPALGWAGQQIPVQQPALGSGQQVSIQQPALGHAQQVPVQQPAIGWAGQYIPVQQPALNSNTDRTLAEQMQSPSPDRFGWEGLMAGPSRQQQLPPSPPIPDDEFADVAEWVKQP